MKKIYRFFLFLTIVSSIMAQEAANVVKVTVDGLAYMGDTDTIQAAKERAMKDAERKAIEQGTGLYIESYSKVHNYMTVEDEIKSMATGYIASKKVLIDAMESDPPRYHVQIEAEVRCGDLGQLIADKKEEEKPQTKSISYEYAVTFESRAQDGSWQKKELKEGDVVRVGDRLRVEMRPANPCHLIMVMESDQGQIKRLLPSASGPAYKAEAGQSIRVPSDSAWLVFEQTDIGNAAILLFASQKNMAQLNWLLEKAEHANTEGNTQAFKKYVANLQKRPFAVRRAQQAKRGGRRASRTGEMVIGSGILVKTLRLQVQSK